MNTLTKLTMSFSRMSATGILLFSATSLHAQDWRFDPIVKVAGEYDDNAELDIRTDQEVTLEGLLLELSANVDYSSPRTSFSITPRVLSRNYSDNPELESDDVFVRSTFGHRMRSSSIGLRVNFDQQTVRTGERSDTDFDIDDPDEIGQDDSGRVFLRGDRSRWRLNPSWGYRFSDVNSISADINYYDVDYEDVFLDSLDDYTDGRLNLFYRHAFSNVNTGVITATGRQFETADGFSEVSGVGAQVGLERSLSETTNLRALIGFESTDETGGSSDTNVVGNVTLTRTLETIRMFAQYRRAITGTGAGRLSVRESLSLNFNRQLSEKIGAGIGVRAYQSRGINDSVQVDDRDYVQLRSQFIWYWSRQLSMEFDYRFTMINRQNLGERANSNSVMVWFSYQPNRIPE